MIACLEDDGALDGGIDDLIALVVPDAEVYGDGRCGGRAGGGGELDEVAPDAGEPGEGEGHCCEDGRGEGFYRAVKVYAGVCVCER